MSWRHCRSWWTSQVWQSLVLLAVSCSTIWIRYCYLIDGFLSPPVHANLISTWRHYIFWQKFCWWHNGAGEAMPLSLVEFSTILSQDCTWQPQTRQQAFDQYSACHELFNWIGIACTLALNVLSTVCLLSAILLAHVLSGRASTATKYCLTGYLPLFQEISVIPCTADYVSAEQNIWTISNSDTCLTQDNITVLLCHAWWQHC